MTLPETFITKFTIGNPNNCWLWTAATVSGYGVITINSVRHYAHRYMYEHHNGPVPTGKYVYHTCDERSCVNPDHLFVGVPSLRKHEGGFRRGEDHPKAKLSRESVVKMRDEFDGTRSCVMRYAKKYNVVTNTIMPMLRGRTWKGAGGRIFTGEIKMDIGGRGNRRLTQKQIDDIRARYANGETQASLAREYGVHYSHVSRICRGERWGK